MGVRQSVHFFSQIYLVSVSLLNKPEPYPDRNADQISSVVRHRVVSEDAGLRTKRPSSGEPIRLPKHRCAALRIDPAARSAWRQTIVDRIQDCCRYVTIRMRLIIRLADNFCSLGPGRRCGSRI